MHFFRFGTGLGPWLALLAGLAAHAGPVPSSKPADYPNWWFERDVIPRKPSSADNPAPVWPTDYTAGDDYAVANIGQLKYVVAKAAVEMQAKLPGGIGADLTATINSWSQPPSDSVVRDDFAAINLGQLKGLALPFYQRLREFGYTGLPLPWTEATTADDDDYALVNLGQLKFAFSFSIGTAADPDGDQDEDGLADSWEWTHFGSYLQDGDGDFDGDGYSNLQEMVSETDPADRTEHPAVDYWVVFENSVEEPVDDPKTFGTLRAALEAASANPDFNVIEVEPGCYTGAANTDLTNLKLENVLLVAKNGPGSTFIDGQDSLASGIELGSGAVLSGFSLLFLNRGVVLSGEAPRLNHCVIRHVPDGADAALTVLDAEDFSIQDTTVEENQTRALFLDQSDGVLSRVILRRNRSLQDGGALLAIGGSTVRMENSLVISNSAVDSGGAFSLHGSSTSLVLDSCTVLANQDSGGKGALVLRQGQAVTILNSVFWNEEEAAEFGTYRVGLTASYSLIRGGFVGPGNLDADPLLSDAGVPASNSPVIDCGPLVGATRSDLYGQSRPSGLRSDIGAVEFQNGANLLPEWWQLQYFGVTGKLPEDDADGDGLTNLAEFLAGTDPSDAFNGQIPLLTVLSGQNQHGSSGTFLPEALVVAVTDAEGQAGRNIALHFKADDASADLSIDPPADPAQELVISTGSTGAASVFVKP